MTANNEKTPIFNRFPCMVALFPFRLTRTSRSRRHCHPAVANGIPADANLPLISGVDSAL